MVLQPARVWADGEIVFTDLNWSAVPPALYFEFPHLPREPLDTILVLPRELIDFLHGVVNLRHPSRHLIHRVLDLGRQAVELLHFLGDAASAGEHFFGAVFEFGGNEAGCRYLS